MSTDISFDDNQYKYKSRVVLGQSEVPGMAKFLIGKGIVKSEKQAQGVLLATTVVFLLASIYIFAVFVFDVRIGRSDSRTPEQIQKMEENKERVRQLREKNSPQIPTNNIQSPQ